MKLFLVLLLVAGAYAQYKSSYLPTTHVSLPAPTWSAPKTIIQGPSVSYAAPQSFAYAAPRTVVYDAPTFVSSSPVLYAQRPALDLMKSGYSG